MADIPVPPPPPPPASDPPPPIIQPDQPQSGGPSPPTGSTRSSLRSDAEAPHDESSDEEGEDEDVEDPTQRPTMVVLWAGISTFFVETSVHGFKYIVEDTAALWEKLFWTITLALSLTTAGKPYTQCLKITEKVSFKFASEASYVYILSGQKLIKNAKNGQFWRVFENLKLAVK